MQWNEIRLSDSEVRLMKLFKFFMSRILTVHFDRSSKKNFAKDSSTA